MGVEVIPALECKELTVGTLTVSIGHNTVGWIST